jgi:hypothetical protein
MTGPGNGRILSPRQRRDDLFQAERFGLFGVPSRHPRASRSRLPTSALTRPLRATPSLASRPWAWGSTVGECRIDSVRGSGRHECERDATTPMRGQ